ncbi:restriction endonuclease subunit R, partial [Candidatus Parcubacteria bacterium]
MNINLKEYQRNKVDELLSKCSNLLSSKEKGKICVFQSPTGSGKTVMTAKFIEEITKELPDEDLCFIWISIGKGDLHIQSKNSLVNIFDGFPRVSLLEDEFSGSRERITRNEVVVVNWEKIRSKDSKSGKWKNILMKDGEKINFRQVLEKTREQRKIILIIDESHIGSTAERTNEIKEIINADLTLEMSATPVLTSKTDEIVKVSPSDVIEQGMIKKEIVINEDLDNLSTKKNLDSQDLVLEAAYQKRIELKKSFAKEGSNINPLVLIQIPTAEAGEDKIKAIRKFLDNKNINEKNRKSAIWLSEQKSDFLDWVADEDSEV